MGLDLMNITEQNNPSLLEAINQVSFEGVGHRWNADTPGGQSVSLLPDNVLNDMLQQTGVRHERSGFIKGALVVGVGIPAARWLINKFIE